MTTPFSCTCLPEGQTPPHSRPEQCRANRAATAAMMGQHAAAAIASGIARGEALAARHDDPAAPHLTPHHGCPLCPIGSVWRRDGVGGEWHLPATPENAGRRY